MTTKRGNLADVGRALFRPLAFVGVMALLVGASGCATVYRTAPGSLTGMGYKGVDSTPLEQVYITTEGYYCLWSIPIMS